MTALRAALTRARRYFCWACVAGKCNLCTDPHCECRQSGHTG